MRKALILVPAALALIGARGDERAQAEAVATEPPAVVDAEPLSVPIIDGGRITGTLVVDLAFEATGGDADALGSAMPQLRAATRAALAEHARLHASPWQAVDARELARALDSAGKPISPAFKRALITEVRARRA